MKNKRAATVMWGLLLVILSIITLIISITNIIGIDLPDTLRRILGILDLVALPVMIFFFVKRFGKE